MTLNPNDFYPEGYGPRETRQSVLSSYGQNPDQLAGDIKLAQQFGSTVADVTERRDDFLKHAEADEFLSKTAEVPALKSFVNTNPQNAALIKDDLDNAVELGKLWKLEGNLNLPKGELALESSQPWRPDFWTRMGERVERGAEGVQDAIAGSRAMILENLFGYSDSAKEEAQTIINRVEQHAQARETENLARSDNLAVRLLESSAEVAPQIASQVGTALIPGAGPLLSSLLMGSQISGGQYANLRSEGVEAGRAATAGLVNAALQTPLEYLGLRAGLNIFKSQGLLNVAKATGLETVLEPLTEYMQEYPDAATTIWGEGEIKNMDLGDQSKEFWGSLGQIHERGIESAMAVSLFGLMGGGATAVHEYGRVRTAQTDAALFDSLDKNAGESKLRNRLPEAYEALVGHLTKDGPVQNVYVNAQTFREAAGETLYQKTLNDVGISADEAAKAEALGADLVIPMPKYQARVAGTDLSLALREHLKFKPDAMTLGEAAAWEKDSEAKYQTILQELDNNIAERTAFDEAVAPMQAQLEALHGKDAAKAQVALLRAGATQSAARWSAITGETMTPAQWLTEQAKLRVQTADSAEGMPGGLQQADYSALDVIEQEAHAQGIDLSLSGNNGIVTIHKIVVPKDMRGQGVGSGILQRVIDYAEENGHAVALTPSSDFGGSKSKLKAWYKRFGFSQNIGRKKMFSTMESFVRLPANPSRIFYQAHDEALRIENEIQSFEQQIDAFANGKLTGSDSISVGSTPPLLQMLGASAREMRIPQRKLAKIINKKHGLDREIVKQLPQMLADPVAVFQSSTMANSLVLLSDAVDSQGRPVIVAVHMNVREGRGEINEVASMYGREGAQGWLKRQVQERNVLYLNKEKATQVQRSGGLQLPKEINEGGKKKILTKNDLVNRFAQHQDQIRGQVQFGDAETVITLFKDAANLSTFLHEIGHVFIKDLEAAAATGKAGVRAEADLAALQEFAGDLSTVEAQEKLARAFEAYLREGKAPSPELRSAFRRFADWLAGIYKTVRGLNVEINDEVRGVFDRMLAAEAEIDAAKAYHEADAAMATTAKEMMTEDEAQRYETAKRQAYEKSKEARQARALRAYWEAMGGKKAIYDDAKAQIDAKPVYAAQDLAVAEGGLNHAQLVEFFGEKAVRELIKKRPSMVRHDGAVDIEQLAQKYGFANGEALYAAMLEASGKMRDTSALTRQMLNETEQSILAQIKEDGVLPGDEDYHNQENLTALIMEERALARKAGQTRNAENLSGVEFIQNLARQVLESKPLRTAFSVSLHSAAEARAAGQAAKALAEGRLEDALELKRRQAINHAMVIEAVAARDERAKHERLLRRALKSEQVPHAYKEQIKALAGKYGILKVEPMRPEELTPLRDFIESVTKDDIFEAPPFEDWLLIGHKPDVMTLGHLKELWSMFDFLAAHGDPNLDRLVTVGKGTVADAAEYGADIIRNSGNVAPVYEEGTLKRKASDAGRDLLAGLNHLQYRMMAADGYMEIGKRSHQRGWHSQLFARMMDAHNRRADIYRRDIKPRQERLDMARYEFIQRFEKQHGKLAAEINGVKVPENMREVGRYNWTAEHIWCLARNMGNAGNLKCLHDGYGLSDDALLRLTSILTKDEWLAVQEEGRMLGERYDETDAVFRQIYGKPMPDRVATQPLNVITAEGETLALDGWYFKIEVDPRLNPDIAEQQAQDIIKGEASFAAFGPTVAKGHTNARTGTARPVALSFDVFERSLWDQIHFITHAPILKDIDRITRNKDWRQAYIEAFGQQAYDEIRPTLKYYARPASEKPDAFDGFLDKNRQLATLFVLGHNVKSFVRQFGGAMQAMPDLGAGWLVRGFGRVGLAPLESFRAIKEMSPYIADRDKGYDREMREALRKYKATFKVKVGDRLYTANDVHEFTMSLISIGDRMCTFPIWQGAYMKATEKLGMNQADAIAFANNLIQKTQASATPLDLTRWQRDGAGWKRLFTMFMSEAFKKGSRMRYWYGAYRAGKINIGEYAQHVGMEILAPAIVMTTLFSLFSSGEPPDKEDLALAVFNELIGPYPMINQIFNAAQYNKSVGSSPAFAGLDAAIHAGEGFAGIFSAPDDSKAWARFFKYAVDVAAFTAGIGNVRRIYETAAEGWEDMQLEDSANPFRLLFRASK